MNLQCRGLCLTTMSLNDFGRFNPFRVGGLIGWDGSRVVSLERNNPGLDDGTPLAFMECASRFAIHRPAPLQNAAPITHPPTRHLPSYAPLFRRASSQSQRD